MLQKEMEAVTMVMVTQVTKFMKEHIVLEDLRKTDDVQVQIDVALG